MGLRDGPANCQTQARAARAVGPSAIELLENSLLFVDGKAWPPIENLQRDGLVRGRRLDLDRRSLRRILCRILQKVDQQLADQHIVYENQRKALRQMRGHLTMREVAFHALQCGADDLLERVKVAPQLYTGFQTRHVEQIAD